MSAEGYGTRSVHNRNVKAHRLIYEECFGAIPDGFELHHTCENRACVNPEHLQAVTRAEHVALHGSVLKAWASSLRTRAARTHCKNGHEWSAENTRTSGGRRYCRVCDARRTREYLQRRREKAAGT